MPDDTLQSIEHGLSQTRDNLVQWAGSTPEDKQQMVLGAPDAAPFVEHVRVIDQSLERIKEGSFGICEVCNEPVEAELLRMDYTACVCLGHFSPEELRQLESELELSQVVQRALLPQQAPHIPGLSVAAFSRPAQIVSGDYFDFIQFKDGGHGIIMADVSGHGVSAGMLMTSLQTAFHTLVPAEESPLNVLERINHLYAHNINFTTFVTIFFGKFDPASRLFTYASAGHNSAYLYRAADGEEVLLHPTGPAIGLMEGFMVRAEQVRLEHGDILVLYTDGVTEASNPGGEQLGLDRLTDVIRDNHSSSAEHLIQKILEAVNRFTEGSPLIDDVTLLVCRVT